MNRRTNQPGDDGAHSLIMTSDRQTEIHVGVQHWRSNLLENDELDHILMIERKME